VLYPDIRFLVLPRVLLRWLPTRCLLLLQCQQLLLLLNSHLVALFQRKLGILAVDALSIYGAARLLDLSQNFEQILGINLARSDQCKKEGFVRRMHTLQLQLQQQ